MEILPALAILAVAYCLGSLRVLKQYERGVNFFLGKFTGERGPGLTFVPLGLATMKRVSPRIVALDIPPHGYQNSTLEGNVLSPGEQVTWIRIADQAMYLRFRDAYRTRLGVEACFCSTLGDCWVYSHRNPGGRPEQRDVAQCPASSAGVMFDD